MELWVSLLGALAIGLIVAGLIARGASSKLVDIEKERVQSELVQKLTYFGVGLLTDCQMNWAIIKNLVVQSKLGFEEPAYAELNKQGVSRFLYDASCIQTESHEQLFGGLQLLLYFLNRVNHKLAAHDVVLLKGIVEEELPHLLQHQQGVLTDLKGFIVREGLDLKPFAQLDSLIALTQQVRHQMNEEGESTAE